MHSYADGRIRAVGCDGDELPFYAARSSSTPDMLHITGDGHLEQAEAASHRDYYRHAPYSRSVLLQSVGPRLHMLCFTPRSGREPNECAPMLWAVLVEHTERGLQVLAATAQSLASEPYGLVALPARQPGVVRVLCGTQGRRESSEDPFCEFRLKVGTVPQAQITARQVATEFVCRSGAQPRRLATNPCWSR